MFEEIKRTSMTENIVSQVLNAIGKMNLEPGQKIPTEREFSEEFNVSRPAVREALSALTVLGVIERHGGRGSYIVESVNSAIVNNSFRHLVIGQWKDALSLLEARKAIECELVVLASERKTDEDLALLLERKEALDHCAEDSSERVQQDLDFHIAIGIAAKSELLQVLQASMCEKVLDLMKATIYRPGGYVRANEEHQIIYDAIRDNYPAVAYETMSVHLERIADRIKFYMENYQVLSE